MARTLSKPAFLYSLCLSALLTTSCANTERLPCIPATQLSLHSSDKIKPTYDIKQITQHYYETYAQRKDINEFMAFYAEDVVLTDVIQHVTIEGKPALTRFFDWHNPAFKTLAAQILVIEEQIFTHTQVVTSGYFTEFEWYAKQYPAMQFTTTLTFNEKGKIIKHIDWIDYPHSLRPNEYTQEIAPPNRS